jgi:hypothetical protein
VTGAAGVLLVPQKDLDLAKSRLCLSPSRRRALVVAMLRRTVRAAAAARFAAVLVVLDNPADATEVADLDVIPFHPGVAGLNASLSAAEEAARAVGSGSTGGAASRPAAGDARSARPVASVCGAARAGFHSGPVVPRNDDALCWTRGRPVARVWAALCGRSRTAGRLSHAPR